MTTYRMVVIGVVPFSAICCLNLRIFLAVRRRRRRRGGEERLTLVLIAIVTTFLVCNLPRCLIILAPMTMLRLILNLHEMIVLDMIKDCRESSLGGFPVWSIVLGFVSHVLLVINSSANLFIYCAIGAKFRAKCWAYILCRSMLSTVSSYDSTRQEQGACRCPLSSAEVFGLISHSLPRPSSRRGAGTVASCGSARTLWGAPQAPTAGAGLQVGLVSLKPTHCAPLHLSPGRPLSTLERTVKTAQAESQVTFKC